MLGILPKEKLARREAMWFWVFIAPWVIGFILFRGFPILVSFLWSFTQYNVASDPIWIGFQNYNDLFNDRIFFKSLQVSATYTFAAVPLGLMFSLALAMLLNQRVPFLGVFRTFYYLPSLLVGSYASLGRRGP